LNAEDHQVKQAVLESSSNMPTEDLDHSHLQPHAIAT
jgi:hypothetical protein